MSVIGIGTDIIEINRIVNMSEPAKEKLAKRILTASEYQRYININAQDAFLAKRWAAKEATAKALGTGIAKGVSFQHIEIHSLASGKPILVLSDIALSLAQEQGATQWHVSLADEKLYATAFVILSQ
ncbi:holo-ACP synthase [Thalassotalea profundi]|uniref:Holo-[acyl-carrier-protein] synthase n=1 Tax=Thalassotalea profundi TaxID=2036687 RepID=A0ABQ3IJ91_9GAMM|nr:holo-ACP synthase [Thalassotalea profundi]GHE86217.1 holo-[acyl-carrier-protein] synthase [Thalassotalea profundi]